MRKTVKKIDKYKRKLLKDLLSKCTEKQQKFFKRLYPMGIEKIPYGNFNTAIQQVERTIEKNGKEGKKLNTKYNRFEIMDI